ncbi:aspartate kinase [Halobacteriovorax sp. HLS]|uniref:aspartate kinase n=1 Tax=Halobacteriovorax sp. HLS TaxID=2234000 RepID=UPI000FDAB38F|nr:aspartate kinase [Halobacteriovorax sp. HLS]
MKLYKFGGSSVKDATAMRKVTSIIEEEPECSIVVISATKNTTNELELIAKYSLNNLDRARHQWLSTLKRHQQICEDLGVYVSFEHISDEVLELTQSLNCLNEIEPKLMDQLYSVGERISTLILNSYLQKAITRKVSLKDVREVLFTDEQWSFACPIVERIKDCAWPITNNEIILTQGFIGRTVDGATTTLGREGSDFSATLLAQAHGCNEVCIWTDVEGVATLDPRLSSEAQFLSTMSYDQAATLASLGAKVLFKRTLEPAKKEGFLVRVKSTMKPDLAGTVISSIPNESKYIAMAVEGSFISIIGRELSQDILKNYLLEKEISPLSISSTENSISFEIAKQKMNSAVDHIHDLILTNLHNV